MRKFRPTLEMLETRNLAAANITAVLSLGVLTVKGTPGLNQIAVSESQNQISVPGAIITITGRQVNSVASNTVYKIIIETLGANDTVLLNGSQPITQPTLIDRNSSPSPADLASDFSVYEWAAAGVKPSDVYQQEAPTCGFLAPLQTLAQTDPSFITSGITYLGSFKYDVRLFRPGVNGTAGKWIEQQVYFDGTYTAMDCKPPAGNDFWCLLYQRAWDQERAFEGKSNVTLPSDAFLGLTGQPGYGDWATNLTLFQQLLQTPGVNLVVATKTDQADINPMLIEDHAYAVVGLDANGNLIVRNPWGYDGGTVASGNPNDGLITLTWAEFSQSMLTIWYS